MRPVRPSWALSAQPQDTVLASLDRSLREGADDIVIGFADGRYTLADLDRQSTRMAHAFRLLGVRERQCVTTMLDNQFDVLVCWLAINKLGAIWVPVNTAFKQEFLRHQIVDSASSLVICDACYVPRVADIAARLPDVGRILVKDHIDGFAACPIPMEPLDAHRGKSDAPLGIAVAPRDLACLIYTSGTTGPSKGCMISHNYLCNFARNIHEGLPIREGDILWSSAPLFHINGIAGNAMLAIRYRVRFAFAERFSLSGFWPDIERTGATMANLIGSPIPLLCKAPETDAERRCYGQLRCVWGAPISPGSRAVIHERFGVEYVNSYSYGQSEGCKLTTVVYGEPVSPPDAVGRIHEDFEVRIFDEEDRPLPPDTPGEIVYRPNRPHIMFEGYWRRPQETLDVWRGLWMHSGDIGKLDGDGNLYFIDRKKDYMRRGGENVSSVEIETIFLQHPAVADIAVHAVPSELAEDEIKATIVLREGGVVTAEELCRWSIEMIPYFAVPRFIEFRTELPRNPTGRVLKYQLRAEGCTPSTHDMRAIGIRPDRRS